MTARRVIVHSGSLATTAALGPFVATPAHAANLSALVANVSPPEILLVGSLALLVVGLVLRVVKGHSRPESAPEGSDLRWWKNPQMD